MSCTASQMIAMMYSYLGAVQGDAKHHHIVDTYNKFVASGQSKGSKYVMKYNDPWCATTISAAAIECGATDIIPTECSCTRQINLFRQMGRFDESDDRIPYPGEIVYYNWDAKTSPVDVANHVGIVETVDRKNNCFTVIEGNYNGKCQRRKVTIGWRYIYGFAVPVYENEQQEIGYVVKKGDSLSKIAQYARSEYGLKVTWKQLADLNGIKFPYTIYVGQVIKVK